jgi:hypothetical protein
MLHVDSVIHAKHDTTNTITVTPFKRPLAEQQGSNISYTNTAIRYYGSQPSFIGTLDESVAAYALNLGDQGYGRESFLRTSRVSEPLVGTFLNGVLPLNDPIGGASMLNFYPTELASQITLSSGSQLASVDHGSSDAVNYSLETFRAPLPYSRIHYTQELTHSFSNVEGLFSVSPSNPLNITLGLYRRASGRNQAFGVTSFNPRSDLWWVRSQASYSTKDIQGLFFLLYNSSFTGLNGGGYAPDSVTDIFDPNLAPVKYPSAYQHRTRLDLLAQLGLGLLSDNDPTQLSAYATLASRRFLTLDSLFPNYLPMLTTADRYGAIFQQPAALTLGAFSTRALLRADLQYLSRQSPDSGNSVGIIEKRYSAMASDSISLGGAFGISAVGFFRSTVSQLTVAGVSQPSLALSNFGLEGSARISRALSVTGQINYSRDRATLSPNPTATYELKNLGFFVSLAVPLGKSDSIAITAGYLDRTEPEGIILTPLDGADSVYQPTFSSTGIHSSGINGALNFWFDKFRFSAVAEYLPSIHPVSNYSNLAALRSDLTEKIFGSSGLYYESELSEGALRLSLGARVRYYNRITPTLGYDPSSDYYVYQGLPRFGNEVLVDSRLTTPKYLIDILASALIDQRAYLNVSFFNILDEPYFNTVFYPRNGFSFKIDVTWAFLN